MTRVSQFCDKGRFSCKISLYLLRVKMLRGRMASKTDNDFGAPFSRETGSALSHQKDQLDLAGQAILSLLEKAADAAEDNNRRLWRPRRSSQLNFAPQKLGSLNWKPRISFIARGQRERKIGCAEFIRKSRKALSEKLDNTI